MFFSFSINKACYAGCYPLFLSLNAWVVQCQLSGECLEMLYSSLLKYLLMISKCLWEATYQFVREIQVLGRPGETSVRLSVKKVSERTGLVV